MDDAYQVQDEATVLHVHLARTKALIEQDIVTLIGLVAPELRYVHATGRVDSFDSYLNFVPSVKYISIEANERETVLSKEVAIVSGNMTMCIQKQGNDAPNYPKSFFMEIWKQYDNGWKLLFFQSTAFPF